MPDYFVTYEKVKTIGNLPGIAEAKVTPHFPTAKDDVLDVIGQETYDAVHAMTGGYTQDDFDRVQSAETYLTLKYLIPAINIESTGSGVTKATGFGENRKENLSEFDLERMIDRYQSNAMKILKRYARSIDEDEDENEDIVRVQGISMACITEPEPEDE